jgi:hypothetical protein
VGGQQIGWEAGKGYFQSVSPSARLPPEAGRLHRSGINEFTDLDFPD